MNNINGLRQFIDDCWTDIFSKINNAAVYIDHGAAECLHWYTGDTAYASLKNAGATSIHEIAMYNFRYARIKNAKKAMVISTSADRAFYQRIIKMIIDKNDFEHIIIICAVRCNSLNPNSTSSVDKINYIKLKEDIIHWLKSKNPSKEYTVEVLFRPIFFTLVNNDVFVTPPVSNFMPPLSNEITGDLETSVEYLVSSFHSLFTRLNLREDVYSIGKFSNYVADKLENLPAAIERRNNAAASGTGVSVILVDRTLDLCTATSNNTESTLSKILCTLPHLTHQHNDVAVNMSLLFPAVQENSQIELASGCLATTDTDMINLLMLEKQKDLLLKANKILMEMSKIQESPKAKIATRISVHSLEKLVHKFRDIDFDSLIRTSKKLQIIVAIIEALKSEKITQLELLISLEKLILQNLAISRDSSSILAQLSNIIKTRAARGLDMENLLALLIFIHALAGTEIHFSVSQIEQLTDAIADALYEDLKHYKQSNLSSNISVYQQALLLLGVKDDAAAKETCSNISRDIMNTLQIVTNQRKLLQDYPSLMSKLSPQEMVQCIGILEQLVTSILRPDGPDLHDLQRRTGSLISTGFNLFLKGRAKSHPCDNSWIIIYVIGGITAEEVRKVQNIIMQYKPDCRITLGGSRLLTPLNVVNDILLPCFNIY